jgi:hypothetical protein
VGVGRIGRRSGEHTSGVGAFRTAGADTAAGRAGRATARVTSGARATAGDADVGPERGTVRPGDASTGGSGRTGFIRVGPAAGAGNHAARWSAAGRYAASR